jgi:hypothetical protein
VQVKKLIKLETGTYLVEGDFSEAEMEVIVEAGLNLLLETGALPFTEGEEEDEPYLVHPPSDLKQ